MFVSRFRTEFAIRVLMLAAIVFNTLSPTLAFAKSLPLPSNSINSSENQMRETSNEVKLSSLKENNYIQRLARPTSTESEPAQETEDSLLQTGTVLLQCDPSSATGPFGGSLICPNQAPGISLTEPFEKQGGLYGPWANVRFKLVCQGGGCEPPDIYYQASLDVTFEHSFGDRDYLASLYREAHFTTTTVEGVQNGFCGRGLSGSCHFEIAGKISKEMISQDPANWVNNYLDFYASSTNDTWWGSAHIQGTVEVSLNPFTVIDPNSVLVCGSNATATALGGYGSTESSCDIACVCGAQGSGGDPINTRTGAFSVSLSDISVPTSAGDLIFQRSYSSAATSLYNSTLGYGWTHNQDAKLILPADPGGSPGYVIFKAVTGNQYKFKIESNGSYTPTPGVTSTLTKSASEYTLTTAQRNTFSFDLTGKLLERANALGQAFTYHYDTQNRLDEISATGGSLQIHYDAQGRIDWVKDHTGRQVSYEYDSTTGDLIKFHNVLGQTWRYAYEAHRMTQVKDPDLITTLTTHYDLQGRADIQWNGTETDKKLVELTYNADGTTTVTDANGSRTHTYDTAGTLIGDLNEYGGDTIKSYDANFRPDSIVDPDIPDPDHRTTTLNWSDDGANLKYVQDALGGETFIKYEDPDDPHNPTQVTDPLGNKTTYAYANTSYPTLPTQIEYRDAGGILVSSTSYDYYDPTDSTFDIRFAGKVQSVTDALGHKTLYEYEPIPAGGYKETIYAAHNTPSQQTTITEYDELGRLIKIIDPASVITLNKYDAAGRLIVSIHNVDPSHTGPADPPQNVVSGDDTFNLYTRYYYDVRGNQIAVVDTDWNITRTYYDLANRPIAVVQNLVMNGVKANLDSEVRTAINTSLGAVDPFDPEHSDWNMVTRTEYDDAGNVIIQWDPLGIITRTYYDPANRRQLVVQNWAGTDLYGDIDSAPVYNPAFPDQNIHADTFFDANGNVIGTKDTLGIIARTYYDELNRPEIIVQNLVGRAISVAEPPDRGVDVNIRTDLYYDGNGNQIATQDPEGVVTRTYYDALNRPTLVVQNWAGSNVYSDPAPDRALGQCGSEVNICTETFYDQVGNVTLTVDGRGVATSTAYDEANRPKLTVQNPGGALHEQRQTEIKYDANGRRDTTKDLLLNRVTKYDYNHAGQLLQQTVNYLEGNSDPNYQDKFNIITAYTYDALGRQVTQTDASGRITKNEYDDLGRIEIVTQNYLSGAALNYKDASGDQYNITTEYEYDIQGNQIAQKVVKDLANNVVTRTCYDALGRLTNVIRNFTGDIYGSLPERAQEPDPLFNLRTDTYYLGNGSVDYVVDELNKTTDYAYDDLGRLVAVIDPLGNPTEYEYDANGNRSLVTTYKTSNEPVSTSYAYDNLNRLQAVVENYRPDLGTFKDAKTNVRTEYTYDANGNRLSIRDGNSNLEGVVYRTTFSYDPLGRILTEIDPLGNDTVYTYSYDTTGNVVSITDPMENITKHHYDELDRLSWIEYPEPDENFALAADVHFEYDVLGRRTEMIDGSGGTVWSYNNLDLPNSISATDRPSISYGYDWRGNRSSLSYADQAVTYQYNDIDQLKQISGSGLDGLVQYGYDASGRVKSVTRPNGVNTAYNYFDNGWLKDITHSDGATTLASYQYQYYADGNRSQAIETLMQPEVAANNPPVFELGTDATLTEGSPFMRSIVFSDPDSTEWQLVVNHGDGSSPTTTTLSAEGNITLNHVYANNSTYTLSVTLTDSETGATTDTIGVIVANANPVVNAGNDQSANINQVISVNATYTDAGILDTHTATINWGDGDIEPIVLSPTTPGSGTVAGNHSYDTAGTYGVEICVLDSDGGTGCDTLNISVAPNILVLQPDGATGVDTYILSSSATTNYGTAVSMGVGEASSGKNQTARSLLKFDLSSIPANATITSATLSLWTTQDLSNNTRTIRVYRLKRPFNESQATWNIASTGTNWQTAGAAGTNDRENTDIGSVQILANEPLDTEKQISLTPAKIQELLNGTFTNNGFIIKADTETDDRFAYKTSDNTLATQRPKLVIQYTLPAPPSEVIFKDSFETGDFSRWWWTDIDGGDLSVSTQAAAVGTYGMQAVIDDTTSLLAFDHSPVHQTHYSARFYFDPNSIDIPNGRGTYLFSAQSDASWVMCLYLKHVGQSYLLSLCGKNDSGQWLQHDGIYINDAWTEVELEFQAASAASTNDGYMKLWVNDALADSQQNLDNDTLFISQARIGVDAPPTGTTGAMYFDAFESRTGSHIGPAVNGPALYPLPTPPDSIFADGFESNDLSAWIWAETNGGNLSTTAQSAAVGSYGIQAVITDMSGMALEASIAPNILDTSDPFYFNPDSENTPAGLENLLNSTNPSMDVYDSTPNHEKHYNARFYFDPNSLSLPNGQGLYLFAGSDAHWVICLYLERRGDDYRLAICGEDDAQNWIQNRYVYISDSWQAIEIEWQAASAPGANNGYMKLYINDVLADNIQNLDTDERSISEVNLGVDGIPAGTSGTVYFDAFDSHRSTHIGLDPNGPVLQPPLSDLIFRDGFETGDLTTWNYAATGGGDLSVSASAALVGSYGMQAFINDTTNLYVEEWSPQKETLYSARFNFDPNSISIPASQGFEIFSTWGGPGEGFQVKLFNIGGVYILRPAILNDANTWVPGQDIPISDASQSIAVEFKAASAAGANDGYLKLWLNDVLVDDTLSGVDNDAHWVSGVDLGVVSPIPTGTSGTLYFDAFESWRGNYIGGLAYNSPLLAQDTGVFQLTSYHPSTSAFSLPDFVKSDIEASPLQQTTSITIDYVYDPLNRLTEANYSTDDYYHYTYDAIGNRKSQATMIGGLLTDTAYDYDDANRLKFVNGVEYLWDANGNLKNDGVNAYEYDSANRLKAFGLIGQTPTSTYAYNGLGDRLQETVNGNTLNFTMDLNTGLTQALSDGTHHYVYGIDRIAQVDSATEYFLGDALGSVRQLTNQSGTITYARAYDPYGVVTSTVGTSQSAYGYTNEYTGDYSELVYLRARHYAPGMGRFLTQDSWIGTADRPLSFNRWNYVEGNPINFTDPSGKTPAFSGNYPRHCQSMSTKAAYAACVLGFFELEPIDPNNMDKFVEGSQGCYVGPTEYRAPGYLEGINLGHNTPFALSKTWWGREVVYDFATMQRQVFDYTSYWGHGEDTSLGVSGSQYVGVVKGLTTTFDIDSDYGGVSESWNGGASLGVGAGVGYFQSQTDPLIRGGVFYVGGSIGVGKFLDVGYRLNNYTPWGLPPWNYFLGNGLVDLGRMQSDIRSGLTSPLLGFGGLGLYYTQAYRVHQATVAAHYVFAYQALHYQAVIGW